MGYENRIKLYKECEELRKRPLIAYVTSIRPNLSVRMASDSIPIIIEQVEAIPKDKKEIDFLIVSNGGDPITSLRIISILRERFNKIVVMIPYVAYSAATILALGADEICMHPYSNLGPIDPQLSFLKQNETGQHSQLSFSPEDIRNYIDFIKTDVGITDQAQLITAFNSLSKEVGSLPIGEAKRSQQLSLSLSEKMLETHMEDKSKANAIAKFLNSSYYHHGYAVSRSEAKEVGLEIEYPDDKLAALLWSIWKDFEDEMHCASVFDPISEIMNNREARERVYRIPIMNIPADMPGEIAQQTMMRIAQNLQIVNPEPIVLEQNMAAIESTGMIYNSKTVFSIVYWRNVGMQLSTNVIAFSDGWNKIWEKENERI